MIKRFLKFIYYIFFKKEEEDDISYDKSYSDIVASPITKIQHEMTLQQKNLIKKKLDIHVAKENIKKQSDKVKDQSNLKLNKRAINQKIRINIFFIDNLMNEMESLNEYLSYYEKLKNLKQQSQNSLKILYRINDDAPYYVSTLKAVLRHTKIISQLLHH